jgi:aspartate dehydrogenase
VPSLDALMALKPDIIVECATVGAVAGYAETVLRQGTDFVAVSIGGFVLGDVMERCKAAAEASGARLYLVAGALAGVDGIAAGRYGKLKSVTYQSRKPPKSWIGSPGTEGVDFSAITGPTVLFEGTARQAATKYPKNANATATVAFAGLGLDGTKVQLLADPAVERNIHTIIAEGEFGGFTIEMRGVPSKANPRTSALTVHSIVRALENRQAPVII